MPDNFILLFNLILAIAPCLVMAICFLGLVLVIATVFYLFIRKSRSVSTRVSQDLSQSSQVFFAEARAVLLPWQSEALSDLSAYMDYSSRTGLGRVHARGKLKSLSQPQAAGWLAFELLIEKLKGTMTVISTSSSWRLQFQGISSRETPAEMDGIPFGCIQDAGTEILLLSAEDKPAGRYQQHQLLGGHGGLTKFAQTPYFGPVELHGRHLAEINRNPILLPPITGEATAPPLVRELAADLAWEEEVWLVALVGWEILYRIVTKSR